MNTGDHAVELVISGSIEPPAFRFSGASPVSLHGAGRRLMGYLAAETIARRRLAWPGVCGHWLPVWLPNLVSNANVLRLEQAESLMAPGRCRADAEQGPLPAQDQGKPPLVPADEISCWTR